MVTFFDGFIVKDRMELNHVLNLKLVGYVVKVIFLEMAYFRARAQFESFKCLEHKILVLI